MTAPVLIVHASGTNRDEEAALAIERAGGDPRIVHMSELQARPALIGEHAALLLPGGFSYGDELGAGARLALDLRVWFHAEMKQFVDAGKPVLGICNGFQALMKSGLLGHVDDQAGRDVTLTHNQRGQFECRWVHLAVQSGCSSSWLGQLSEPIYCPVAHGEGRIAVRSESIIDLLDSRGLTALRYVDPSGAAAMGQYPLNPNGSAGDIAGLCNAAGNVVGLMPHPEDHIVDWQRPHGPPGQKGLALFDAFVKAAG